MAVYQEKQTNNRHTSHFHHTHSEWHVHTHTHTSASIPKSGIMSHNKAAGRGFELHSVRRDDHALMPSCPHAPHTLMPLTPSCTLCLERNIGSRKFEPGVFTLSTNGTNASGTLYLSNKNAEAPPTCHAQTSVFTIVVTL